MSDPSASPAEPATGPDQAAIPDEASITTAVQPAIVIEPTVSVAPEVTAEPQASTGPSPQDTPAPGGRRGRPRRRGRALGWVLVLVLVLALAGTAGWFGYGTDVLGRARARDTLASLTGNWGSAPTDPVTASQRAGQPMATISIPRLNLTWPVVVGTDDLSRGLGWYPGTTWPGERGNAALAGLRVTAGSPLRHIQNLAVGDTIVLTTATNVLTYTVTVPATALTVDQNAAWVLDPVPGHPGTPPTQSLLTLTTAQDLVATSERSVLFATLASSAPR